MSAGNQPVRVGRSPRAAHGRRRRLVMIPVRIAIACVVLVGLWHALGFAVGFLPIRVQRVEIEGLRRLRFDTVLALADVPAGARILQISPQRIGKRVSAHPAVQRVEVLRRLPSTVRIVVTERPLALLVSCPGGQRFVTRSGRLIDARGCNATGLPRLIGVSCSGWTPQRARAPLAGLRALERARLRPVTVSVAPSGAVSARLVEGPLVKMGLPEQLEEKARRARLALAGLPRGGVEYVDVSAITAIVWKPNGREPEAR